MAQGWVRRFWAELQRAGRRGMSADRHREAGVKRRGGPSEWAPESGLRGSSWTTSRPPAGRPNAGRSDRSRQPPAGSRSRIWDIRSGAGSRSAGRNWLPPGSGYGSSDTPCGSPSFARESARSAPSQPSIAFPPVWPGGIGNGDDLGLLERVAEESPPVADLRRWISLAPSDYIMI